MTKNLFPELDFTRENVLAWAEEQVALEPVIQRNPNTNIANTIENVLREALNEHYLRLFLGYDKSDLIEELMTYVKEGLDKPTATMNESELLDEIMTICTPSEDGVNVYDCETMDDFVKNFVA